VFEAEAAEVDVMSRPPRARSAPLFGARTVVLAVVQGLVVLAASLGVLLWIGPKNADAARSAAFTCVVAGNLGLIVANRSLTRSVFATLATRNAAMWWVVVGAIVFLLLGVYVPGLQGIFHLVSLPGRTFAASAAVGFGCTLWVEALKVLRRRA
jgi:Ca2+-transporting ATPase